MSTSIVDLDTLAAGRAGDAPAVRIPVLGGRRFDATVRVPGSKSLTNRALLLAALAGGSSTITGALLGADDTERMIIALEQLGARIHRTGTASVRVEGVAGVWNPAQANTRLDLGNAGTAVRFLTAAAILAPVSSEGITIDGDARMRERPIGELVTTLRALGVEVRHEGRNGVPPVLITPARDRSHIADRIEFGRVASSQFVSALLLIAPWLRRGLTVSLPDGVTSRPYVTMTLQLLRRLGADVRGSVDGAPAEVFVGPAHEPEEAMPAIRPDKRVTVLATRLGVAPFDLAIEPDASSAGYFWAAAAMCPGSRARVMFEAVTGDNASAAAPARGDSSAAANGRGYVHTAASSAERLGGWGGALQGDVHLVDLLERMGAQVERTASHFAVTGPETLRGIDADLADIPDAAMALSVVCCFAKGPSTLRGLHTLRVKETDRLAALSAELTRVGVGVEILSDGDGEALRITPPAAGLRSRPPAGPVRLETYRDHRMAMALALFGLALPGIEVADPGCVAKTYPAYWRDLRAMIG